MANKFTQKAQNTLKNALSIAEELGFSYIGSEHLLLALSKEQNSISSRLLCDRGAEYPLLKSKLGEICGFGNECRLTPSDMTPRLKKIIEESAIPSKKSPSVEIGTEELLLSLLSVRESMGYKLLEACGISPNELRNDILSYTGSLPIKSTDNSKNESNTKKAEVHGAPNLSLYAKNLSTAAVAGKLDPIIGREEETDRVIRILSRRMKNNPCLVGEAGVGKTAVAEGLAKRIAEGRVPETLKNKQIVTLDVSAMLAGAKYRGEFEERMKSVMDEVAKDPDIILFIDEIHTIAGAGAAEGAVDAANIIKPALARSEMQIIGATTLSEYRTYIEKDAALERRFQPVVVNEPTEAQTKEILLGIRPKYEDHHSLKISDEAIDAAIALSVRYIPDRFLPDKAIDLIDEAASMLRISALHAPDKKQELEAELNDTLKNKERAIKDGHLDYAQRLRLRELELLARIKEKESEGKQYNKDLCLTEAEIADVVTSWTSIPVSKLIEKESAKLLSLESELKQAVIGQDSAVEAVAHAIKRARVGLKDPKRPSGSFIFLGSTGTGKTELSRALARSLFGSVDSIIRLDMAEYMEKHSVSKLIGAPPGYVGYGEGGLLTEKVRRRPYSLILLDEIEKAHPDVFNLLLSVLEDGILTDSAGRRVDFRNTVIIMTSNIGAPSGSSLPLGFSSSDQNSKKRANEDRILSELRGHFSPEFLNRVDEVIVFNLLSKDNIKAIASTMLSELCSRAASLGITLEFDESVCRFTADKLYDEKYGARSIRREIVKRIEDRLSSLILDGKISSGDKIKISTNGEEITFVNHYVALTN